MTNFRFLRYGFSIFINAIVTAFSILLFPWLGITSTLLLLLATVSLCAHYLGTKPAIISLISAILTGIYIQSTQNPIPSNYLTESSQVGLFAIVAALVIWLNADPRRATDTLQRSTDQLQQLAENIQDVFWIRDTKTNKIIYVNPAYESIWESSRQRLYEDPDSFLDNVHPDDQIGMKNTIETPSHDGVQIEEYRILSSDGSVKWINSRSYPVKDRSGAIYCYAGIAQDITNRKKAEEEKTGLTTLVRSQSERINNIISDVPGIVWQFSGRPDETGHIEFVSEYAEKMLGYNLEDWFSKSNFWLSIIHPHDQKRASEEIMNIFISGRGGKSQFRWITRDERIIWVETHLVVICDAQGIPMGLRGVTLDISDHKRAEEGLLFLAQAGEVFAASPLDYEARLRNIARLAVPTFADWCLIDMVDEDNVVKRLAIAHSDPLKVEWAHGIQRENPFNMNDLPGVSKVIQTGEPEYYPRVNWEYLDALNLDAQQRTVLEEVGINSVIIVPMIVEQRVIGVFTFVCAESGRHYTQQDLNLAQELARRAAIAVENAKNHRQAYEQRAQLQTTLASIGEAVIVTDTKGRVRFMNIIAQSLTGWKMEDAEGQSVDVVFRIINTTKRVTNEIPIGQILREGKIVSTSSESILVSKDGKEIAVESNGAPIHDVEGIVIGAILVFRNITERKQNEKALQDSERRFRQLAENAQDVIYQYRQHPKPEYAYVSPASKKVTGYSPEEYYADSQLDLKIAHPGDRQRFLDFIASMSSPGEPITIRTIHKDGRIIWVEHRYSIVSSEENKAMGIEGIARDVTDRKQAEEDLKANQRRAELLQRLTGELSKALTPQQVADALVGHGLEAMGAHIGLVSRLTDDGQMLHILNTSGFPSEIFDEYRQIPLSYVIPLTDAVRTGEVIWIETFEEFIQRYPDLETFLRESTYSQATVCLPLKANGKIIGGINLSFPTPKLFSDEELQFYLALAQQGAQALERARIYDMEQRARKQAEEANNLKVKFLAMISHELRTPLTSILGFATTLLAKDVTWDSESQREFIEIIDQESRKLADLIEQLLDLSRLNAGKLRIQPEMRHISEIFNIASAQIEMLTANHYLHIDMPPALPQVMVDPYRIAQVLVNLVGNAAKYSPIDTDIVVSVAQKDDFLYISVRDQGQGIPVERHEDVFEAFRQIEEHHGSNKGAGLGLAICKGLVEAHGGSIWIEPQDTPGLQIIFTLPIV